MTRIPLAELVVAIEAGRSPSALDRPATSDELGVLRVSAISSGTFRAEENKALPADYDPGDCPRVNSGDLLFSRANTRELVGAVAIAERDYPNLLLSDKTLRLQVDSRRCSQRYLLYYLRSPGAREYLVRHATGTSGSMLNISQYKLRGLPVPALPLPEQRRIADILDKADALRRKRREALQLLDDLLRSVFLDMFGDPVTNPRGWPILYLDEVASFVGGGTPSRAEPGFFQGNICWATAKDMGVEILTDTEEHITPEAIERSATKLVPAGTVLVVVKSKVLAHRLPVAVTALPTCFGQDLKGIVPKEGWPAAYLAQQLRLGAEQLLRQARGANTEGLTLDHLRAFPVFEAPSVLRSQYSGLDATLRNHRRLYVEAIEAADTLFNTLLHRAFTGEL